MSPKRVLVTGAGGFVGAVLTRRLVTDGHEVHVLVRPGSKYWRLQGILGELHPHVADLRDGEAVREAVRAARPEWIYHLATHGAYAWQGDAEGILATNVLGTANLLAALEEFDYELFVNAGSSSEYGKKPFAMRETDPPEPVTTYGVAKVAQTLLCQQAAREKTRPIVTLRLFSVYGPFEEPTRLVPTLVRRCLEGKELELADPEIAHDFVFVEDVVEAFLRTDELRKLGGEIVNIGSGVQTTLAQLVDLVLRLTQAEVRCRWGAFPRRSWDTDTWVADRTKARRLLGWEPVTPLAKGLARTITWTREREAA
ncbi:MAG: CDP-abequose synthase [Candidatus Binatia bacterium]|nr:MAG: CDP-abequose synthase [Candidatus Binatia bacterium]